jgi:hypothetical protein
MFSLFRTSQGGASKTVACIDVGSGSVAGAYAVITADKPAMLLYAKRVPIIAHENEAPQAAMLRALAVVTSALIQEGAPVLRRAQGSGSTDAVLVSLDAPWQTTELRTESTETAVPFVFTKHTVRALLSARVSAPKGRTLVNESIIGTLLNGYETRNPYGQRAHRATVIALTSYVDESVLAAVGAALRSAFHTRALYSIAGSSLRYQAIRAVFSHEDDALVIDATNKEVSIALIRHGLLVATLDAAGGEPGSEAWQAAMTGQLRAIAKQYPLPRTIFVLSDEAQAERLRNAFAQKAFTALWLTDKPPTIVPVAPSHIASLVTNQSAPDLLLAFMAIYWSASTARGRYT